MSFHLTCFHQHQPTLARESADLIPDCDCFFTHATRQRTMTDVHQSLPSIYALELTYACNNQCAGCSNLFVTNRQADRPLSWRTWQTLLATIAPHARRLALTGGEPTRHPHFDRIVDSIQYYEIPFTLFTNGRWQEPEQIINLLVQSSCCSGLLISLHGANAETHDAFTGVPGSFDETIATIRQVVQAGLPVHTNTVLLRSNYHQIEAIIDLSHTLGAACAVFNRPVGTMEPLFDLPPELLAQTLRQLDHLFKQGTHGKIGSGVPLCRIQARATGCSAGYDSCTIDPWGTIRPCNHAPHTAGNLLVEPLESIWGSQMLDTWRNQLPDACKECALLSRCNGGCRADALLRNRHHDPLMVS